MRYVMHVVPDNLSRGTNAVRLLLAVLEDETRPQDERILLVGRSPDHSDLFYDFWTTNKRDRNAFKALALGRYEEDRLIFPEETPLPDRVEVMEFLAGQALWLMTEATELRRQIQK